MGRVESSDRGAGRLRAVVFDFDGVILESADIKTDAFVELFSHLTPEQVVRIREHHLANLGISRFVKFEWVYANLLGEPLGEPTRRALGDRFAAIVLEKVLACSFVGGAEQALATLAGRYPLFVASGTPQDELDHVVEARGLRGHFREVWGSPREKADILDDIAARHGWRTTDLLFVGDGTSDARAAAKAGTQFLARTTRDLHQFWIESGARRVTDLTDLAEVVESW